MKLAACLLLSGLFVSVSAPAREIAGVNLPEKLTIPDSNTSLVLNGAGTRNKFFLKIYVAGLYLTKPQSTIEEIINLPGPKRVHMHFLYKQVEQKKLVNGWQDGFKNNLDATSFTRLAPRLEKFNQLFRDMKRDDTIDLDLLPGRGTRVWINGQLHGEIPGDDFYAALLKVWLGLTPADAKLKAAWLQAGSPD